MRINIQKNKNSLDNTSKYTKIYKYLSRKRMKLTVSINNFYN